MALKFIHELREFGESQLWTYIQEELYKDADVALRNAGGQDINTQEGLDKYKIFQNSAHGVHLSIQIIAAMIEAALNPEKEEDDG